uniref:GlcG/HbpS family heme-binding protein n=2 Tax=Helicobacter TaxID=209 RepID=UPI0027120F76
ISHNKEKLMKLNDEICEFLRTKAGEEAAKLGIDISFAVVDESGILKLFQRFGEALLISVNLVLKKAYTAVITRSKTKDVAAWAKEGGALMGIHTTSKQICLVAGGYPLFAGERLIGGIGVGGGSEAEDLQIAEALLEAFKERYGNSIDRINF